MNILMTVSAVLCLACLSEAAIISKRDSLKESRHFLKDTTPVEIERVDVIDPLLKDFPIKVHDAELIASLPEIFDPRDKWPNCPNLNQIRDQGACSSCWVVASVAAMTDRLCIRSNGTIKVQLSAQDLLSCENNFFTSCSAGGSPTLSWILWKGTGIVTESCKPYEIPTCAQLGKTIPCYESFVEFPKCEKKCRDSYNVEYNKDKYYGKSVYGIKGEDNIRAELFVNGPVVGAFEMYADFNEYFNEYKTGIYSYQNGSADFAHAVKIIGWGVDGNEKYWLVANSMGTGWGDHGFFKIRRGSNECGIEGLVVAGEPAL